MKFLGLPSVLKLVEVLQKILDTGSPLDEFEMLA